MDGFFLLLRVLVSLAVVFGLLFYLRKKLGARWGASSSEQLRVIERKQLAGKSSLALVEVSGKRYLLGVAESSVNVLDSFQAPPPELAEPLAEESAGDAAALREREFAVALNRKSPADLLAGSILSAQTWRNFRAVLRRTVR